MIPKPSLTFLSVLILILLSISGLIYGRVIVDRSSNLIFDGVHHGLRGQQMLRLNPFLRSEACEQTYGFMPCTTTVLGNLFLLIVFGYLMFLAATYLSSGSELLLEILGPGIIGGLLLPVLSALPDAMLILGTNL